ncbi:hypothetical protein [Microvirga roseola]|uniref:hypothetical protein n=1 Tax=Microvirga roseola TaxID=2883126 RepID=UPI001E42CAFF|nr:hypothetical protein [Microvirga roseola]
MSKALKPRPIIHDPFQGELWVIDEPGVTNTISLWDVAPRSIPSRASNDLKDGKYLKTLERTFTLAGKVYQVSLKPARIKDKDGKESEQYPGERERLVEWVIRRIAAMRNRISLSAKDEINVSFSINEVKTELARTGHTYSYYEIVEALTILHQSLVEIVRVDVDEKGDIRERVISSAAYPQLAFANRGKERAKSTVQFNWLVSQAMMHLDFRQMNYEAVMKMRGPIERWIYMRLNHDVLYHRMSPHMHVIYASEVIDGSALATKRPRDALRRITEGMENLKNDGVIKELQCEDLSEGKRKVDIKYTITVSESFVEETSRSLRRANENIADFRAVVGSDPNSFVPSDPIKKEKLRRIRTNRLADQNATDRLL